MEVTRTEEEGNIEVRCNWDESGKVICLAEMKFAAGLTPEHFKYFFENWYENILEVNLILNSSVLVETVEGYQVIQTEANAPLFFSNRGLIMTKYPDFNRNFDREEKPGEHCLYMSSLWNEKFE